MRKRYTVTLTDEERRSLRALVSSGKGAARKLTHAQILLKADSSEGGPSWTDTDISEGGGCRESNRGTGSETVCRGRSGGGPGAA
jgi:hypothetical protein